MPYVNEHSPYGELARPDRHALRDILKTAFSIGRSSHELWSDFVDTTAFLRRATGTDADPRLSRGIVGGAIVMSHEVDQLDYLAYIAIHPEHRYRRRLLRRGDGPHHGTLLLRYVYDVMRSRVTSDRVQSQLVIEPYGDAARDFYLRALPVNDYPLQYVEADNVICVAYDGMLL